MPVEFIAEGRIVWGHPGNAQKAVDPITKKPKLDKNGNQREQYVFGLAVEKQKFNNDVWPYMHQESTTAFPAGAPADFAWKFKDADTQTDKKGKLYSEYEGRAGCMVLTISTEAFAPPLYKMNAQTGQYDQITAEQIKCGDYVAVSVMCKFNGTNGLYLNPQGVVHIGYGSEIVSSGFDVDEKFAGYTAQLPPGASAVPVMAAAPLPGAMNAQSTVPAATNTQPTQAVAAAPAAPGSNSTVPSAALPPPAHDFVQNAGQVPAQPPAAQPGVAAPTPQPTPVAAGQLPPGVPPQGR